MLHVFSILCSTLCFLALASSASAVLEEEHVGVRQELVECHHCPVGVKPIHVLSVPTAA
jgi:hypothetical protein